MKTITIEIDPATLSANQNHALRNLNAIYKPRAEIVNIENYDVVLGNDELVRYYVEVDEESPTYEGDAFFREDFLCGIMDLLDAYK